MKSHGLLFSAPMALANVQDRKSQTRRILSQQAPDEYPFARLHNGTITFSAKAPGDFPMWQHHLKCKYTPGDTIYQKETFSTDFADHYPHDPVWYRVDNDRSHEIEVRDGKRGIWSPESKRFVEFSWTPSLFMPRESSRFTAKLTEVRIQRLQDITEADAITEGLHDHGAALDTDRGIELSRSFWVGDRMFSTALGAYRHLWNSIHLKPSPVYGSKDKQTKKRPLLYYVSYPWCMEDLERIHPAVNDFHPSRWREIPLLIIPNPWVTALTYKRLS